MKKLAYLLTILIAFAFISCSSEEDTHEHASTYACPMKCEGDKTYDAPGSCPVCKMDLVPVEDHDHEHGDEKEEADTGENDGASIFNLTSEWKTEENETIKLEDLKGDVMVVTMIYTTCKAACPRLIADVRAIDEGVNDKSIKFVFVSIDPETDTPEKMKQFAIDNEMDDNRWTFLQGTVDNVREFSNVLSVKYKKISPIDFSHSNIITVFDQNGNLAYQQEGLGVENTRIVNEIKGLLTN